MRASACSGRPASHASSAARYKPAAASLVVTRELGRTLERTGGSGEAAPSPRTLGRELQFLRDVVVLAQGSGRTVPGPSIRVLLSIEYLGQHPVHVAALL